MENKLKIRDTRKKDYFTTDNEIIDIYAREIGTTALAIYFTLCRHSDKQQESFPSQQIIADKLGISRDTVIDKIKVLSDFRLIQVDQTKDKETGKWLHNTYTLLDKTVWIKPPYGGKLHTGEANTVSTKSDTNNTNNITRPIENFQNNFYDPAKDGSFDSWKKVRFADKTKGPGPSFSSKRRNYGNYEKPKRRNVDLSHIV